jgi:hypothetical protein
MNLFHRPHHEAPEPDAEAEGALEEADYDAQADLALPTVEAPRHIDVGAPFAGSVDVPAEDSGYDVERDISD